MKKLISKSFIPTVVAVLGLAFFAGADRFTPTKKLTTIIQENHKDLPEKANSAFSTGEVLNYRLHYGIIDAGVATLEVKPEIKTIGGREVFHIVGNGYSKGSFDWFFKVRDRYETYIDKKSLVPWLFIRRCDEGGYITNQDYVFNHFSNKVDVGKGEKISVPASTQDMISAFYAARNFDFSNVKEGDIFSIPCIVDKEMWDCKIKFICKETINSDLGKVRCLKFRPIVQKGRIFKKEEDLNVWITDDKNHIPIRAQAKIMFGSVKMDLSSVSNLANPIALVK